ncbi:MAG: ThiF family adenylyltransferase [archaeon]
MADNPIKYEQLPGAQIGESDLLLDKAKEFVKAVKLNPFTSLVEIRKSDNSDEIVIIDVEVELPQKPKNPIKESERIGVIFYSDDKHIPETLALRSDFPLVPHTNLRATELPRSLCLYEESYQELKLQWSSFHFLEKIRNWLRLTAKGKAHAENQSLEPLLAYSTPYLVLPLELLSQKSGQLITAETVDSEGMKTILAKSPDRIPDPGPKSNYILTIHRGKALTHGIIRHIPATLKDLDEFLKLADINLLDELWTHLKLWNGVKENRPFLNSKLIIVFMIPERREAHMEEEEYECRAFCTELSINRIGEEIGLWTKVDGLANGLNLDWSGEKRKDGSTVRVDMLNVTFNLTPENASLYNGAEHSDQKISAIGSGTIGSQVFNILSRQGLGKWTLIDNDIILPHNLARHVLASSHVGQHKAKILAQQANELYGKEDIADYLLLNVLDETSPDYGKMLNKLKESNVILDFSASIPVARHLASDIGSEAKRISAFFTPSGQDSVMIAEDKSREYRLDMLEMQYYRAIVHNDELNGHLQFPENRIRYGHSCRDISTRIPFDLTAQHAAVCSTEIKSLLSEDMPIINIWRADKERGTKKFMIQPYKETRIKIGEWTLVYDDYLIEKVYSERRQKLPNETGGALIGAYDRLRKIIYVVDSISSPSDSIEWPTVYIRGIKGLQKQIQNIEKLTYGMLDYLGEWHSHPEGFPPCPSPDDIKAFGWLIDVLNESGLMALMLIVGDDHKFYLGGMADERG